MERMSAPASILGLAIVVFYTILLSCRRVDSESTQEKQALLDFLRQVPHSPRLNWTSSSSACDWFGVGCDSTRSSVLSLRLPGAGLFGPIPPNTIGLLTRLRVLSLRSNRLSGPVPDDFSSLALLRSLYLQDNAFSGEFPPSVTQLTRLSRLDISSNDFSGSIPFAVNNLTRLTGLFLENNNFSGTLPSIDSDGLNDFSVANNSLNGSIPASLSKFPASAFAGNLDLCGGPLTPCSPFFGPSPSPGGPAGSPVRKKSNKLSTGEIVGIAVGCTMFLLLLLLVLLFCLRRRQRRQPTNQLKPPPAATPAGTRDVQPEAGTSSSKDYITGSAEDAERNKLIFLEGGVYTFDLEDLLRASAEVLGKGSVGTSYKAILEDGTTVMVKRLKDVAASKKEFDGQMDILGQVKHENVVPLRAYYYSKDEKLLVYDFMSAGSLSALLHGSRGSGRTPLDWENRLKIAIGVGHGLAHLHHSGKVPHGNIKSSNILIRPDRTACISDFGLNPLFGNSSPPNRVVAYHAPEVVEIRKATFKSDVYSFGVLLLELLTGKAPNQASLGEEGIDLPRWVQSVVREEWTAEVFDAELMRYTNIVEEMVQLLQIAMACVYVDPDERPDMGKVVRMMEEMRHTEVDDSLRQSSDDPSKGSGGHTPSVATSPPRGSTPP
ncbi:hypothetical protein SAY86_026819 [Trapa natans]|uniref:Protein kinase domain-containing protein n=1 Tax=Trapa natans TaxID=22666 RepID=A0AAN7KEC8_TRANT|nr:hypothetical protein SAY86_026819 [Trapa natans]